MACDLHVNFANYYEAREFGSQYLESIWLIVRNPSWYFDSSQYTPSQTHELDYPAPRGSSRETTVIEHSATQ